MDRPPHLVIDLNEAPSPPPGDTPPAQAPSPPPELAPPVQDPLPLPLPPPPPPQQLPPLLPLGGAPNPQALLQQQQEAVDVVLRVHRPLEVRNTPFGPVGNVPAGLLPGLGGLPLPPPAPHPGEAGWGNPPAPCSSCGRPEVLGGTLVCDACDRGFHPGCVRVWPPLLPPPPPPGPPGARRPRAAANEDWICPDCERRGARSTRWKLGTVQLDINAAPPEDPVVVSANDIRRQELELSLQIAAIDIIIERIYSILLAIALDSLSDDEPE